MPPPQEQSTAFRWPSKTVPAWGRKRVPSSKQTPFQSSHRSTAWEENDNKKSHTQQAARIHQISRNRRALQVSEAGSIFAMSIRVQAAFLRLSSEGGISAPPPLHSFQKFYLIFLPKSTQQINLSGRSVTARSTKKSST